MITPKAVQPMANIRTNLLKSSCVILIIITSVVVCVVYELWQSLWSDDHATECQQLMLRRILRTMLSFNSPIFNLHTLPKHDRRLVGEQVRYHYTKAPHQIAAKY
jgi:hypothetical protein